MNVSEDQPCKKVPFSHINRSTAGWIFFKLLFQREILESLKHKVIGHKGPFQWHYHYQKKCKREHSNLKNSFENTQNKCLFGVETQSLASTIDEIYPVIRIIETKYLIGSLLLIWTGFFLFKLFWRFEILTWFKPVKVPRILVEGENVFIPFLKSLFWMKKEKHFSIHNFEICLLVYITDTMHVV